MPCSPLRRSRNHCAIAWSDTGRPATSWASPRAGSRRGRDPARLVLQRQRVHPRQVERLGMPLGHRLVADEHEVEVAGPAPAGVERLLRLVARALDRRSAPGDLRAVRGSPPGASPRTGRIGRYRRSNARSMAPGEQRRLLGVGRPEQRERALERRRVVERRADVQRPRRPGARRQTAPMRSCSSSNRASGASASSTATATGITTTSAAPRAIARSTLASTARGPRRTRRSRRGASSAAASRSATRRVREHAGRHAPDPFDLVAERRSSIADRPVGGRRAGARARSTSTRLTAPDARARAVARSPCGRMPEALYGRIAVRRSRHAVVRCARRARSSAGGFDPGQRPVRAAASAIRLARCPVAPSRDRVRGTGRRRSRSPRTRHVSGGDIRIADLPHSSTSRPLWKAAHWTASACVGGVELDRDHQALAADVADEPGMGLEQRPRAGAVPGRRAPAALATSPPSSRSSVASAAAQATGLPP